jgi:hypothetical protein
MFSSSMHQVSGNALNDSAIREVPVAVVLLVCFVIRVRICLPVFKTSFQQQKQSSTLINHSVSMALN